MTGTTVDYSGRQLDMELLQHVGEITNQRVFPAADHAGDGSGPRICAGMEKVVQRYAKLFLTTAGSVKFDPYAGGTVLSDMRAGRIQSMARLSMAVDMASAAAVREMKRDDADETFGPQPDDEKIDGATVVGLDMDDRSAKISVHVLLVTRAGSAYSFVVPVKSGVSA